MPTVDTGTHHITVRQSPTHAGHLEFTAQPCGYDVPKAEEVALDGATVLARRKLTAVQVTLNRNDAMILSGMLEQIAYELTGANDG